eukprot:TRINITY_DN1005_c0_g1_i1.p1 TRINITY_DN1005_c0_g1~~TRINITY_DN1005_c0_g1_i1.p1  ORF type:complete len:232 (+),score=21.85 TRINITY_DN1005_c0_g1_i1:38-697(+)
MELLRMTLLLGVLISVARTQYMISKGYSNEDCDGSPITAYVYSPSYIDEFGGCQKPDGDSDWSYFGCENGRVVEKSQCNSDCSSCGEDTEYSDCEDGNIYSCSDTLTKDDVGYVEGSPIIVMSPKIKEACGDDWSMLYWMSPDCHGETSFACSDGALEVTEWEDENCGGDSNSTSYKFCAYIDSEDEDEDDENAPTLLARTRTRTTKMSGALMPSAIFL